MTLDTVDAERGALQPGVVVHTASAARLRVQQSWPPRGMLLQRWVPLPAAAGCISPGRHRAPCKKPHLYLRTVTNSNGTSGRSVRIGHTPDFAILRRWTACLIASATTSLAQGAMMPSGASFCMMIESAAAETSWVAWVARRPSTSPADRYAE